MVTIKLSGVKYVVMAMLNQAHTGGDNYVITTPTGDRVECILDGGALSTLDAALAAGDIFVDLS